MPTWRANYFDNPRDNAPSRSEIIVAEEPNRTRSVKREATWVRRARGPR